MRLKYLFILLVLATFTSCGFTDKEKREKTNIISDNLHFIIDSLFNAININPEIQYWQLNYNTLKKSKVHPGNLEVEFSFRLPYSSNPREYYDFEGKVYADVHNLQILKINNNKYLIEMNVLFHGDDAKYYTVEEFSFDDFIKSDSKYSIIDEYNKPVSIYFNSHNIEKKGFLARMSQNDKAASLVILSPELKQRNCTVRFNDNWLEISMDGNVYPINAGNPESACKLFFEKHSDILKYCSGIRLFNDNGIKLGVYRNPNDKYN